MTVQEAKNKLIAWARSQIGYTEGANNWNKYAQNRTEAYGWNVQNQPWCDVFVDAGFLDCFGPDMAAALTYQRRGAFSAKCSISADRYKAAGAWSRTPEPGDQIFFYYDGGINHTGIVESVGNGLVITIEGNSADAVSRRSYGLASVVIAGYGRPNWSAVDNAILDDASHEAPEDQAQDEPAAPTAPVSGYCAYTYAVKINLLKKGCYGPQVANMQRLLRDHGFDPGEIDGKFGAATYEALEAFQTAAGIQIDGEWGAESFGALWNY